MEGELMPLYIFSCPTCGEFDVWRRMSEVGNPVFCGSCQAVSRRIYSAPNVNLNSGSLAAIGRSPSTEPRVVKRSLCAQPTSALGNTHQPKNASGRPWMIGHPRERL